MKAYRIVHRSPREGEPPDQRYFREAIHEMNTGQWSQATNNPTNPKQEVRVIDPLTGGEKGSKLARFSLIPREFLWALAEHYGVGSRKYADRNWEKGYKWSLSLDALERHLNQWLMGEDKDVETGSHHLIAVAWHACALFTFQLRGIGTDDVRPPDEKGYGSGV